MEIYVLNSDYERISVLDEYEEVLWQKKYNDVGECRLKVPCSAVYVDLLRKGNYLYRYDDDMLCKIETIELETDVEGGDYLIITAFDICSILSGRIVRWQLVHSGKVKDFIKELLTKNALRLTAEPAKRRIDNLYWQSEGLNDLNDNIEVSTTTGDLLQLIITTCKTYNYGFRVSLDIDTKRLYFRLYKGSNKATTENEGYVEFSPEYANIITSSYRTDDSNYKNVVYVSYKGDDEQVYLLSMYAGATEPAGEARREVYVDGTGTSRDITIEALQAIFNNAAQRSPATMGSEKTGYYYIVSGGEETKVATFEVTTSDGVKEEKITVTDFTYLLLIRAIGENTLAERVKTQEFSGEVDTIGSYEWKRDYDLGDIVMAKNEYGIEAPARIVEIMESDDLDNGHSIEPVYEYNL